MQVLRNSTLIEEYIMSMRREINPSLSYEDLNRRTIAKLNEDYSQNNVRLFFNSLRKTEASDPFHKWIGTYNLYAVLLKRFFKWFGKLEHMEGINQLKRKEKSIYKPSDLWTVEDDLIFLQYCNNKRDKCYHAIAKDSSCRPSEILRLKVKDIVFKHIDGRQYAEILVNGKTGTRHIPLINSIPYLKDWLDNHYCKGNPHISLICSSRGFKPLSSKTMNCYYRIYKTEVFPKLLKDPRVNPEDKKKITALLEKPWNPYIFRHSALTEKSKILKEHILRQHAGWTSTSEMPQVYLHYFGNESSESILEAYGLKPKQEDINRMKPVQCPNCSELNAIGSKFCMKCRMVLTYDAWEETTSNTDLVKNLNERLQALEKR